VYPLASYRPVYPLASYRPVYPLAGYRPVYPLAGYRPVCLPAARASSRTNSSAFTVPTPDARS
jgi:hypothetical protein